MSCSNCFSHPSVDCGKYTNAHCVYYSGSNLTSLGVHTNDRLDVILAAINAAFGATDISNLVPYEGAVDDVDLGIWKLTTSLITAGPSPLSLTAYTNVAANFGGSVFINVDGDNNLGQNALVFARANVNPAYITSSPESGGSDNSTLDFWTRQGSHHMNLRIKANNVYLDYANVGGVVAGGTALAASTKFQCNGNAYTTGNHKIGGQLLLTDTITGTPYRIEVISGVLTATPA